MNRLPATLIAAVVASVVSFGCSSDGADKAEAKTETTKSPTPAAGANSNYFEVPGKNNRLYVVSTKETADKVKAGSHPQLATTKIGYGPKGETVVFEADAKGEVEQRLMAEYAKRHGK